MSWVGKPNFKYCKVNDEYELDWVGPYVIYGLKIIAHPNSLWVMSWSYGLIYFI